MTSKELRQVERYYRALAKRRAAKRRARLAVSFQLFRLAFSALARSVFV